MMKREFKGIGSEIQIFKVLSKRKLSIVLGALVSRVISLKKPQKLWRLSIEAL